MPLNRKLLRFTVLLLYIAVIAGCEKDPLIIDNPRPEPEPAKPEYDFLEATIRAKYDNYAVFPWSMYEKLLTKLSDEKFMVLPLNEMRQTFRTDKVVIGLRHDVDFNPYKAREMAFREKAHDIRSTYFFLATADYSGKVDHNGFVRNRSMDKVLKDVDSTGSEIGIHNDLLTVWLVYNLDPFIFNSEELAYYKSLKIPIYGSAGHGSWLGKIIKISCNQLFSDFAQSDSVIYEGRKYRLGERSMKDYGFEYEAYFIDFGSYYSDSGGVWKGIDSFEDLLRRLDTSTRGERIQILIHPDWWGRKEY